MALSGRKIWGAVAIGFGALTIFSGFSVLFGGAEVAAMAGNVVKGILWLNAVTGFVYIAAGVCIYRDGPYAGLLTHGLVVILAVAFAALGLHIAQGGAYEMRTVGAMTLRLGFWLAVAVYLYRNPRTISGADS